MANEIQASGNLGFTKGSLSAALQFAQANFTMAGTNYERFSMSVPTSATAIPLGGITTPGWFLIVNKDLTNYVEIYVSSGGATSGIKIPAGGVAMGVFIAAAPALKANTAGCVCDILLIEA